MLFGMTTVLADDEILFFDPALCNRDERKRRVEEVRETYQSVLDKLYDDSPLANLDQLSNEIDETLGLPEHRQLRNSLMLAEYFSISGYEDNRATAYEHMVPKEVMKTFLDRHIDRFVEVSPAAFCALSYPTQPAPERPNRGGFPFGSRD